MKNRSLVLTVSLIAMMIVGAAHGAQIASTDYVTKSVGDEADLVWTAIDSINNETTGVLATAKSYTDTEITAAMEEVADALPTVDDALSDTSTNAVQNKVVTDALNGKMDKVTLATVATSGSYNDLSDKPTVDDALSDTSTNAVQNKVVTVALDGKLGKNEKAASAATADSATTAGTATSATQDASGNVITETYATKGELSSGLSGKLDTTGSIAISQVNGLSDALAQAGSQLSEAQTAAVNSGITQAKVEVYDAYAGQIASKADASALSEYATNQDLTDGLGGKLDKTGSIEIAQVTGLSDALANAGSKPDAELSTTSENSVQNKIVTAALNDKLGKNEKAASATTADSATTAESATKATQDASGNVITETYATKTELGGKMDRVTLATVATSGSYNDLSDKPTIDDALSSTSTNAVQNKVVTAALNDKLGKNEKAASATTADSATTATKATQDASGNVITTTYATKGELPGAATASAAGIMKWGQIPSGSETATTSATIWVQ
ncbi:MAG: hypothetical protein IKA08_00570 [Alphaproteobacteria bacterium]|nr:hypothetical protein [Alphaproteobacteria bacterium]